MALFAILETWPVERPIPYSLDQHGQCICLLGGNDGLPILLCLEFPLIGRPHQLFRTQHPEPLVQKPLSPKIESDEFGHVTGECQLGFQGGFLGCLLYSRIDPEGEDDFWNLGDHGDRITPGPGLNNPWKRLDFGKEYKSRVFASW